MKKEVNLIKMNNKLSKEPEKIKMPPLDSNKYDIDIHDDTFIRYDNDSIYAPLKKDEDNKQNNS